MNNSSSVLQFCLRNCKQACLEPNDSLSISIQWNALSVAVSERKNWAWLIFCLVIAWSRPRCLKKKYQLCVFVWLAIHLFFILVGVHSYWCLFVVTPWASHTVNSKNQNISLGMFLVKSLFRTSNHLLQPCVVDRLQSLSVCTPPTHTHTRLHTHTWWGSSFSPDAGFFSLSPWKVLTSAPVSNVTS